MNCTNHGGPSHQMPGAMGGCTLCAIEKQTEDIKKALFNRVMEESRKRSSFDEILQPNHWYLVKRDSHGLPYITSIPESEIYIKPHKPWYKRLWSWVFMLGYVPRAGK